MSEPHHGPRLQRTLRMPCDAFHMILSQIQCYIVWLILHDWANMSEQVDLISLWASHLASATCHVVNRGKAFCQEGEEEALYKLKEARDAMAVIWSSFCHCFRNQPNQSLKLWAVSKWEKEPSLNCYNMQVHANRKVAPPPKKWVGVLESQKAAVFNAQKTGPNPPFLSSSIHFSCLRTTGNDLLDLGEIVDSKVMKGLMKAVLHGSASAFFLCRGFHAQRSDCGWGGIDCPQQNSSHRMSYWCHRFTDDF